MDQDVHVKQRPIWRPGSIRLFREASCAIRARAALASLQQGWQIHVPETRVSVGRYLRLESERLRGEQLIDMFYKPEVRELCLDLGIVVLSSLQSADIAAFDGLAFDRWYQRLRAARVLAFEASKRALLSRDQRTALGRLVSDYLRHPYTATVLVHGDLQASHIIVDAESRSLGIIDLEVMRVGRPVTNFAQLWEAYYFADRELGRLFYERYLTECGSFVDEYFDADVRAEVALRCHSHLLASDCAELHILKAPADRLLKEVLGGAGLEQICTGQA